jgi:Protein of unknown function (DUF3293)
VTRSGGETPAQIDALLALYLGSDYDVTLAPYRVATIRIGETPPAALCDWIGAGRTAYFLTACNPRSIALSEAENVARLDALRATLRERGATFLEGVGHRHGETWREPSVLVRDIDAATIDQLARELDQNALVCVDARPARLRIYRREWRTHVPQENVEWA